MNNIKTGDVVFYGHGKPAVVKGRVENNNDDLILDRDTETIAAQIRHGYLNGMSEQVREEFNSIVDKVKENSDPNERVNGLVAKLEEIEQDPTKQSLVKYIKAELSHVMNTHRITTRTYTVPEVKVRV